MHKIQKESSPFLTALRRPRAKIKATQTKVNKATYGTSFTGPAIWTKFLNF